VPFGHLGDGNIHFNVQRPEDMSADTFKNHWPDLIDAIVKVSLSLDGTISAEHGIGRTKQRIFSKTSAEVELKLMRALKAAIDPDELMNPGALF
jgi:FAD/FMN-containing dehydrogenase